MIFVLYIVAALLASYVLWFTYLAIMCLSAAEKEGKLTPIAKKLAYPGLMFGYFLDFLANMLIMTVLVLEIPRELLVTARVTRHKDGSGYRGKVAGWICTNLLDPFDPKGCHCRKKGE